MPAGKKTLMQRFPRFRNLIDHLFESNQNFNDLCRQYGEIDKQLASLDQTSDPGQRDRALNLRRRRDNLESELRMLMDQNTRV
ncbi:MAG: hypothetical protein H6843_07230 [Rhodospirillaceae bacterium]|nr:hypothetical protein [Rhodospirillaceae bacterium]